MLSLQIINAISTDKTRPNYARWLERIEGDRVFLTDCTPPSWYDMLSEASLTCFRENIDFYHHAPLTAGGERRYEVGIWFCGLGHGGPLPDFIAATTEHMTHIRDLETGAEAGDSFCLLDPAYRAVFTGNLVKLAKTDPDLIMIDDDFRLAGHGPVTVGCACPRHMALFNQRAKADGIIDKDMTREELAAILFTGKPTAHRRVWLELQGDTLRDFARDLRSAVDAVNPKIRLGHCACLSTWDLDGVDSIELAGIFAGNTKPFLRLIGAPYWNAIHAFRVTGLGTVIDVERMEKAWCDRLAPDIELMSEGDTFPRPRFNTPASYLECYHQVLTADSFPDILKYMFDAGNEPDYETGYLRLHEQKAGLRRALTEAFADTEGAGIYVYEPMHKFAEADCTGFSGYGLFDRFVPASCNFGSRLGLPISFEKTKYTPVTLVFGESARAISAEELQGHLILDAAAAKILCARGIDVGIRSVEAMAKPQTEVIYEGKARVERCFPVDTDGRFYRLEASGEREILGQYDNGAPAVIACEHDGFTAVVYAFDMESISFDSTYMKNDRRRMQLLQVEAFDLPVILPEPRLYVLCRRNEKKTVVGIWNFSKDIGLPQDIRVAMPVLGDGTVEAIGETHVRHLGDAIALDDEIPPYCFCGFTVK